MSRRKQPGVVRVPTRVQRSLEACYEAIVADYRAAGIRESDARRIAAEQLRTMVLQLAATAARSVDERQGFLPLVA